MRLPARSRIFAAVLACGAGICPGPGTVGLGADPGPCYTHSTPAFLQGFAFRLAPDVDIEAWAERFGFGPLDPPYGDGSERILRLPRGELIWNTSSPPYYEDLNTRVGLPFSSRNYYYECPEPPAEPRENSVPCPPNGALRPLRAIAVVGENHRLVESFTFRHRWDDPNADHYGGGFAAPQVGAVVQDARYPSGSYRFIIPKDPEGIAARWLASGPGWIGVAFQVADLAATERALAERGVPTVHVTEQIGEALWVMPEVTGGPLLEFVQTSYR
jgi:hypothetical protein